MDKIKTLIVEDEKLARDLVSSYLSEFPEIDVIGECVNGFDGLKEINEQKPDLVFLDVQMPKLTGFELLELLEHKPAIVFTTAYDQYAIKAFEQNAVDYLLKPFSLDRFKEAIEKAKNKIGGTQSVDSQIEQLNESSTQENVKRIVVKSNHKISIVPVEDIHFFESQDDYVMIYTGESKYLKQKTMKFYENNLDSDVFVRIHRSYIVNIEQIKQLEPYEKDNYVAILKSGNKLKISQSGLKNLKAKLQF